MTREQKKVLIVDDEPKNLRILDEYLTDENYQVVKAADGVEAWAILEQNIGEFDAVLLDRMMPNMDGMAVLKKIKAHPELKMLPVIMQTAATEREEVLEGLQAGCYYYLAKPFEEAVLISIVNTAVADYRRYSSLKEETAEQHEGLALLESGRFCFRTLDEACRLTQLLAAICPDPDEVALGLSELFINAIEHGNLDISYAEKSDLLNDQVWDQEIERRLALAQYADRHVVVEFVRQADEISIVIKDQGAGFRWQDYLDFSPERATDSHGRGIAMASTHSFDNIEYRGKGNEVKVSLNLLEGWTEM